MIRTYPYDKKLIFTAQDVAEAYKISPASSHVLCSRYVQKGVFIRLKQNFYILSSRKESLQAKEKFRIANILQVPSYISLMTALSFFEITTQVQQNYIESIAIKRSRQFDTQGGFFQFYKIAPALYKDFAPMDGFFIASKEKAFLDCAYLSSFGKYSFDTSSLALEKLDKSKIKKLLKIFPLKTRCLTEHLCKI